MQKKREGAKLLTKPLAFGAQAKVEPARGKQTAEVGGVRLSARERGLLFGGTAREILARLLDGDPLGIRPLAASRLRTRCLLMDGDGIHLRALALCARHARHYRGQPAFGAWLRERVDAAIDALLAEQGRQGSDREVEGSGVWSEMAPPLGLDPEGMRVACTAFNQLGQTERQAFFELVIDGRCPDEWAHASGINISELARCARRGLDAVLGKGTAAEKEEAEA